MTDRPEPILQFFAFDHLDEAVLPVCEGLYYRAMWMVGNLPRNPERTVALRKLLEAKDAAVRSLLYKESGQ